MAETVAGAAREAADACPGALRPHHAADGELLRIRVPGGAVGLGSLRALAIAGTELADGRIGLTSRGNLQVRGVREADVPTLLTRLRAAGLLPAAKYVTHERVRNIIASPLSGRRPQSLDDVDPLVHDLDAALCARPGLAQLPGRFLFTIDDGSGDVVAEGGDVLAVALGAGRYAVRPAGCAAGIEVGSESVAAAMLAVAEAFLAERAEQGSKSWRVAELAGGGPRLLDRLLDARWAAEDGPGPQAEDRRQVGESLPGEGGSLPGEGGSLPGEGDSLPGEGDSLPVEGGREVGDGREVGGGRRGDDAQRGASSAGGIEAGLIEQRDGRFAVCAVVGLGLLDADQTAAVIAAAELSDAAPRARTDTGPDAAPGAEADAALEAGPSAALRVTPWRRIVVRDLELPAALAARELMDAAGLVVTPGTSWSRVTACAGRPGCAKSLTDVQTDARAFAASCDPLGPAVHWAGCERGCGTPAGDVVQVIATTNGYRINGALSPNDRAATGKAAGKTAGKTTGTEGVQ